MSVFLPLKTESGDFHRRFSFVYFYTDLILPKATAPIATVATVTRARRRGSLRMRKPVTTNEHAAVAAVGIAVAVIPVALRRTRLRRIGISITTAAALTILTTSIHADVSATITANALTAVIAIIAVINATASVGTICRKTRITHCTHSIV